MKKNAVYALQLFMVCAAITGGAWLALRVAEEPAIPPPQSAAELADLEQVQAEPAADPGAMVRDRAFIDTVFPLLSRWQLEPLKAVLAPTTLAANSDGELQAVLRTLGENLGELRSFEPPELVEPAEAAAVTAETQDDLHQYRFRAWYERGAANVNLVLQREPGQAAGEDRHLYSFNISVPERQVANTDP